MTPPLAAFPHQASDTIRYGDTDRQGHVNNAVFASFLETGRVGLLYDPAAPLAAPGAEFVIARLGLDFLGEIHWPGTIAIGTAVLRIGTSSVTLTQALYQGDRCVATAETVIVQIDMTTRASRPLEAASRERLAAFQLPGG
jgi:acyl-CoA thioester hydrolase